MLRWLGLLALPLLLLSQSPDAFPEGSLSPHGECFGEYTASFIRIAGLIDMKPKYVAKMDLISCTLHCRKNIDPSGKDHFPCQGFNFHPGRVPTCEFFPIEENTDKEPHWNEKDFAYYYEKTCLKVPSQCQSSSYLLDVRRNVRVLSESRTVPDKDTPILCQQECVQTQCTSFEFDRKNRICSIYDTTRRLSTTEERTDIDYYENNCRPDFSRCPNGRVDFYVVRRSDVASFGISAGIRSIRNCMRECVESTLFYCRSFQFDPKTNECFVSDESSDLAVPSASLDLYEPFCLPLSLEQPCNIPYAFEKTLTTKLLYSKEIGTMQNSTVEKCLSGCLEEKNCRGVNYDVRNQSCTMLKNQNRVEGARTGPDENLDYYEMACEPIQLSESARTPDTNLVETERTIRAEFRNLQHVHIRDFDECRSACEKAVFGCISFAFAPALGACHLSSIDIHKNENLEERTQINKDFDLFRMDKTERASSLLSTNSPSIDSTFPTLVRENEMLTDPLKEKVEDIVPETDMKESEMPKMPSHEEEEENERMSLDNSLQQMEDIFDVSETTTTRITLDQLTESTEAPLTLTTRSEEARLGRKKETPLRFQIFPLLPPNSSENRVHPKEESFPVVGNNPGGSLNLDGENSSVQMKSNSVEDHDIQPPPPRRQPSPTTVSSHWRTEDPEAMELEEENSVPRVVPLTANVGHVPPDAVTVQADCHDNGVNVTFSVTGEENDYTGAVYAAERFTQCRVFVKQSRSYAIFLPRPSHNTWCNALEVDGVLSAVIVMSNDRVLPHDVTTKDDLFYQVTCNYSSNVVNKVQSGIVVGGPSPVSIKSRQSRSFSLQIMQQGEPVESVFIGEKLTARVESDIPAGRLRVTECTATRVGGEVTPATVQLIADGCALMPSIMGPMQIGHRGWEASLNAFRIDGSEQIDIVCLVVMCQEEKCPEVNLTCPPSQTRLPRSISNGEPIRVDHRLKVLGGERENWRKEASTFPEVCVQPPVYISTLSFLLFCVLAVGISMCFSMRRTKKTHVTELIELPMQPRYSKQPVV